MTKYIVVVVAAVSLVGCSGSSLTQAPTSLTSIPSIGSSHTFATPVELVHAPCNGDPGCEDIKFSAEFGHVDICNTSDTAHDVMFGAWDATDLNNQIPIVQKFATYKAGECKPMTFGLSMYLCGANLQRDVFFDVPPIADGQHLYTQSDLANKVFYAPGGSLLSTPACPQPTVNVCVNLPNGPYLIVPNGYVAGPGNTCSLICPPKKPHGHHDLSVDEGCQKDDHKHRD